jgi:hypothetical protein
MQEGEAKSSQRLVAGDEETFILNVLEDESEHHRRLTGRGMDVGI